MRTWRAMSAAVMSGPDTNLRIEPRAPIRYLMCEPPTSMTRICAGSGGFGAARRLGRERDGMPGIVTGIHASGQADPSQTQRFPYCWVVAPLEVSPSAEAEADAEGCLETTACPLIAELPPAGVLPADPWAAAPPPKAPSIPWPSPLLCPELPLCPPPLLRPLLVEVPELDGDAVAACPVPVSAPLVAPLASDRKSVV